MLRRRPTCALVSLGGVAGVTFVGYRLIPVNATTAGFAYLLLILVVASTWRFLATTIAFWHRSAVNCSTCSVVLSSHYSARRELVRQHWGCS
jgi:hypothetical protein